MHAGAVSSARATGGLGGHKDKACTAGASGTGACPSNGTCRGQDEGRIWRSRVQAVWVRDYRYQQAYGSRHWGVPRACGQRELLDGRAESVSLRPDAMAWLLEGCAGPAAVGSLAMGAVHCPAGTCRSWLSVVPLVVYTDDTDLVFTSSPAPSQPGNTAGPGRQQGPSASHPLSVRIANSPTNVWPMHKWLFALATSAWSRPHAASRDLCTAAEQASK